MRDRGDKLPGVGLPRHEQRPRGQGLQRAPWPKELAEAKVQIGRDLDLGARNHRPSRSSGHAESRAHRLVDEQQAPQRVPGVRVRSELPRGPAPARALVAGGEGAGRPVDVKVAERRRAPRAALEPEEDRLVAVRAGAAVILLVVGEEEPAPAAVGAAVGDVARGRDGREGGVGWGAEEGDGDDGDLENNAARAAEAGAGLECWPCLACPCGCAHEYDTTRAATSESFGSSRGAERHRRGGMELSRSPRSPGKEREKESNSAEKKKG